LPLSMAMVALGAEPQISLSAIAGDLNSNWPQLPAAEQLEEKDVTSAFRLGESNVILGHMPGPIPWTDLEGPCSSSVLWPDAAQAFKEHKTHLIVTVSGDSTPVERATLLTQVTAAIAGTCPSAVGVYWCPATLVIPCGMFRDFAIKVLPDGPPLHIWVDFRVGRNPEGKSIGFTRGLAELGLMELATESSPEPPEQLRERFTRIAEYLLENGPVIRDGDTVGADANERIRVVYSKSAFGHPDRVMRLDYDTLEAKKPWWRVW
jgi:hypothetical protein